MMLLDAPASWLGPGCCRWSLERRDSCLSKHKGTGTNDVFRSFAAGIAIATIILSIRRGSELNETLAAMAQIPSLCAAKTK
jgi:hypothetical protein